MQNTSPDNSTKNIDTSIYTPGSSDKKRAVMMYLFLGIMVWITKKNINSFEYYHLKQASGRWILFLLVLVFDAVLLFVPVIKYLWLIPIIALFILWVINVKQARDGKYFVNSKASQLALLSWVGAWFLDLFEVSVDQDIINQSDLISTTQSSGIIQKDNASSKDININNIKSDIELDIQKKNIPNQ